MTSILTQNVAAGAAKLVPSAQPGAANADAGNSVATSTATLVASGTQAAADKQVNKITESDEQALQIPPRAEQNKKGADESEDQNSADSKNKASRQSPQYQFRGAGGKIDLTV